MITKAALLLFRDRNGQKELLFAKPKGKPYFVFPGGKQEAGETIEAALRRELQEELATNARHVQKMGVVEGTTPDGRALCMHLYIGELMDEPSPSAEIESIKWMTRTMAEARANAMTPMTLEHVMPFLAEHKLW